jgi:hypothetical protein
MPWLARIGLALAALAQAGLPAFAAGSKDACTLVTKGDVGQIFGEPFDDPQGDIISASGPATVSQCAFFATTRAPGRVASVTLQARYATAPSRGAPGAVRQTMITMGEKLSDVSGLGDTAIWGTRQSGADMIGELNIFKGGKIYLVVTVDGRTDDAALKQAKALGALALSRI